MTDSYLDEGFILYKRIAVNLPKRLETPRFPLQALVSMSPLVSFFSRSLIPLIMDTDDEFNSLDIFISSPPTLFLRWLFDGIWEMTERMGQKPAERVKDPERREGFEGMFRWITILGFTSRASWTTSDYGGGEGVLEEQKEEEEEIPQRSRGLPIWEWPEIGLHPHLLDMYRIGL
ncbi:hypothetical protein BYT27DRAFT_7335926 [Phlegmacium glaucopus]|nr:hypothetical protein BYT27DRAFT_7335926 [Phlegmacium glaucopus]